MSGDSSRSLGVPVLAGASGILLGVVCQRAIEDPQRSSSNSSDASRQATSSTTPTPPAASPDPGATTRLLREISSLSAEDCRSRVLEYLESGKTGLDLEMEAIFRRWLSLEKADQIIDQLSDPKASISSRWLAPFFLAWVAIDEKAAMDAARHSQFRAERALHAIAIHDPSFIEHLKGESDLLERQSRLRVALFSLGRDAPEIARSISTAELSSDFKKRALVSVAQGWASRNPAAAFEWTRSLNPAEEPGRSVLHAVMTEWCEHDLEAAKKAWASIELPDTEQRPGFSRADPPAPLLLTQSGFAAGHIAAALARDPFLDVAGLYRALSEADIDWDKPGYFAPAIDHDGWYPADPGAAAKEAEKLPAGKARDRLLELICNTWAKHDLNAAADYARSRGVESSYIATLRDKPTEEMRREAFSKPEETFASLFSADAFGPEDKDSPRLYQLAQEWAGRDPQAAAKWLSEQDLPADGKGSRDANIDMLFSNTVGYYWARTDPVGVTQWLDSLPDGRLKSRAWGAAHERVAEYSPDYAFTLGAAWSEGESRMRNLEADLKAVSKNIGTPLAMALLDSPGLSAEERVTLENALRTNANP
ncbi:hypothetical protein [Luteolibacter luteus]|uniref:Uncharacterized protein n=1 Tax=Luteolibacter luteus TaxID=2728835 RepID=A0A858RIZ5_9BACT|nr:hypothetical protein [Luteolibacter luteus]QJE96551.1 hypothetical protein HHL09_12415 [Luteolibacter luteus]